MPIAAKFSEAFYQKFGHEATSELVEYLNTIDATYRGELERLNDLNWSRVESRIAQAEARIAQAEARLDQRYGQLEARLDQRCTQIEARFEQRLAELKAELLKWMFLFWLGTIGTVIALQRL
jgi:DNA anti-recombination protein RmuC